MNWLQIRCGLIALVGLPLGACIVSDHDIAADLKPAFPIADATYTAGPDKTYVVRRQGDEYAITNPKESETVYVRLFQIPEYAGYVLDMYEHGRPTHNYMFLKKTGQGFDVYDIDKLPERLPPDVARLVRPVTREDRTYNTVTVADGRRDTLAVIRALMRANPEMSIPDKNSYRRQP